MRVFTKLKHTKRYAFLFCFDYFDSLIRCWFMNKLIKISLLIILMWFWGTECNFAYTNFVIDNQSQQDSLILNIFHQIERGINESDVRIFSDLLSSETYLSLKNGISDSCSANQSYYILQDYLTLYTPTEFKFTGIFTDINIPYASGLLKFIHQGVRGSAQVFISLKNVNGKWQISQITIN